MPVTDLVFSGRWPEDRRKDVKQAAGQKREGHDSVAPLALTEEEKPSSAVDTAVAIEPLKKITESLNNGVDIQYRRDLEMVVMVVYKKDPETGQSTEEIVRQIPPEDAVKLAQQLEKGKATILDEIA